MTIEMLLADRGYDTDEIISYCKENNIEAVIPPKKNRVVQREYDAYVYKIRHLVENAFLKLKQWRGVATRYAKTTSAFIGAVTVRCLFLWLKVVA
jgi:transposase